MRKPRLEENPLKPSSVRQAREFLGMTQAALAFRMDLNERTVRYWEEKGSDRLCTGPARVLLKLLVEING
jgi:DNA-binding transcriptional regulator YiaG